MRALLILIPLAALSACADPARSLGGRDAFLALGHAPGWTLTMEGRRLKFVSSTPDTLIGVPRPRPEATPSGHRYGGPGILVEVAPGPCRDSRSGVAFSSHVTVTAGTDIYRGCGGRREPMLDR
jgi:uncharacterized membrane protein